MRRYLALLLFVALLPLQAFAAPTVTKYGKSGCTYNGTGSSNACAASNGAAGAYSTIANAVTGELAARTDLVGRDETLVLNFQGTAADAGATIS